MKSIIICVMTDLNIRVKFIYLFIYLLIFSNK